MEREIKFRGKDIETDKWVYGNLIHRIGYMPRIMVNYESNGKITYGEAYAVKRDTIGQFIGLRDKNGKDIYEGDIMQYNSLLRPEKYYRYVIAWNPIDMAFGCASLEHAFIDCPEIVGGAQITDSVIIGNIYDNP